MNQVAKQIEVHIPALMRFARALAHNPMAAEDLVQECLVRALTKANLYRPDTNLRAWLFTILHNLYINDIRRINRWKEAANPEAALVSLSVAPRQTHAVMLRAVMEAMRRLPSQQRLILYCLGVEGKSYKEMSRELGIPIGTLKSRCSRAREALQRELDNETPHHSRTRHEGRVSDGATALRRVVKKVAIPNGTSRSFLQPPVRTPIQGGAAKSEIATSR